MARQATDTIKNATATREQLITRFSSCLASGRPADPEFEASAKRAADFLLRHATAPASNDELVLERTAALEPIARSLVQPVLMLGLIVKQLVSFSKSLPPSKGYQSLLASCGLDPVLARLASHLITRHGEREARDALIYGDVVRAIRFLSKPAKNVQAARATIEFLLAKGRETTVLEPILPGATDETHFISLLEIAAKAGQTPELIAHCVQLIPRLKPKRGPKTSAASFAHQFLLKHLPTQDRAYTFSELSNDFIDPKTVATRLEFDEPRFDPRPARRRMRAESQRRSAD